jgi:predicted GIY-YIG superfamily endonuclease
MQTETPNSERVPNLIQVEDLPEPETDWDFIFRCYIKLARSENWRERLDTLGNSSLLQFVEIVGYRQLTPGQVEYCAMRFASGMRNNLKRKQKKASRAAQAFVIYWLHYDVSPDIPLYVGLTQNIGQRWAAHRIGGRQTRGVSNLESLRIKVVETICGSEHEALAAEIRHIRAALAINPDLLNRKIS